ncbi:MAG: type IV toxin-antitoxin system AbiEi family antitoxin domain-containing protein [Solirubrobacteraceae bacterium]|nr:type IV toxin-antitoxin system AbiEi family antitoxin domain-containing protein [Patulibacter sp.]
MLTAIRELAVAPHWVVTTDALVELGMSKDRIRRWQREGLLDRAARGVYALERNRPKLSDFWAAHLSIGDAGYLSSMSAIDLHGIANKPRRPVHLTVSGSRPRPQDGILVHSSPLLPDDVTVVDDLPCTSVARTLLDVASQVDDAELDRLVDRVVHLRLFDQRAFDRLLERKHGRPGCQALRAAIGRLDHNSGNNRSEHERRLIALIRDSDLPTPVVNHRLGPWEVDVHWLNTRGVVEADSDQFHSSPAQLAADIAKQAALKAYGFVVHRVTWRETNYDTDRTLERIERFRLANLAPPVPGLPIEPVLTTRRW